MINRTFLIDFRGYSVRKRFGVESEEHFKKILNDCDNQEDATRALIAEGVKDEDAEFIVQRWYKKEERVHKSPPPIKDHIHPKLRQADLIQFSQNVCFIRTIYIILFLYNSIIFINEIRLIRMKKKSTEKFVK